MQARRSMRGYSSFNAQAKASPVARIGTSLSSKLPVRF
jgi:hypothetical protein